MRCTAKSWQNKEVPPPMSRSSPPLSGWHAEDVKAAIRKQGVTLTDLARANGFGESYLRNTLMRPLYEGEQIIARFLRTPAETIWPDRYDANGKPNYRRWHLQRSSRKRRAAA
jgi:Ner family transcriptional regulator